MQPPKKLQYQNVLTLKPSKNFTHLHGHNLVVISSQSSLMCRFSGEGGRVRCEHQTHGVSAAHYEIVPRVM